MYCEINDLYLLLSPHYITYTYLKFQSFPFQNRGYSKNNLNMLIIQHGIIMFMVVFNINSLIEYKFLQSTIKLKHKWKKCSSNKKSFPSTPVESTDFPPTQNLTYYNII